MSKSISISNFIFGLIIGAVVTWVYSKIDLDNFEARPIYVNDNDSPIYIKKKNWGISRDKQILAISTNNADDMQDDTVHQYILKGLQNVFYKNDGDTLILFVSSRLSKPQLFNSKVVIKQIVLENPQFQDLYDEESKSIKKF